MEMREAHRQACAVAQPPTRRGGEHGVGRATKACTLRAVSLRTPPDPSCPIRAPLCSSFPASLCRLAHPSAITPFLRPNRRQRNAHALRAGTVPHLLVVRAVGRDRVVPSAAAHSTRKEKRLVTWLRLAARPQRRLDDKAVMAGHGHERDDDVAAGDKARDAVVEDVAP
eukprot:362860-Chlamydomonas_euryale.AAC.10